MRLNVTLFRKLTKLVMDSANLIERRINKTPPERSVAASPRNPGQRDLAVKLETEEQLLWVLLVAVVSGSKQNF